MKTITKISAVLVLSVLCSFGLADELYVPSQYPTIQAAINAAVTGDTVLVADGTYTGEGNRDIDFLGKAITVRSESGPENCIIDCSGIRMSQGFYFHRGEDSNSLLDGFTIINGFHAYGGIICCKDSSSPTINNCVIADAIHSSGIYCNNSSPTINNCIITDNTAGFGGGIHCISSSPTINNCIITGNHASGSYSSDGGGISCVMSSPIITNCIINENLTNGGGGGIYCYKSDLVINNSTISENSAKFSAGIFCDEDCNLTISNCTLTHNNDGGISCNGNLTITNCVISNHSTRGPGGAISCSGSSVIANCTISGNKAEWGGGIYCYGSNLTITNCIISGNSVKGEYAYGGGICCAYNTLVITNSTISGNKAEWGGAICYGYSNATITNCILWGNEASNGPQVYLEDSNALVSYVDVQRGQSDIYLTPGSVVNWGQGNIDTDPCFVESGSGYWDDNNTPGDSRDDFWVWGEGNYHLLPNSPCIDTGDPNYIPEPNETDLDGNPRISGTRIDMGAYEANYIEAEMNFTPKTINCSSKGNWVKAHLTLPDEFLPEDVDVNTPAWAEPLDLESEYIKLLGSHKGPVRLEIAFNREAFCEAFTEPGQLEATIIGSLTTGQKFFATDSIKIIPQR